VSAIKKICVYCGSGSGSDPIFVEAARKLGKAMAEQRIGLVYGGGSVGLMGEVSNAVLDHGGEITGIIPTFLMTRERASRRGEIVVTRDMHERKQQMFERADAFVALPGGIGTLEEVIEQMTWKQLGQHRKPILLANIKGFWDPLCALFDHMNKLAFIRPGLDVTYLVAGRAEDILPTLLKAAREIPEADKAVKAANIEMI
jgi:uncharacterized protein (TIGR00730 family)